MSPRLAFKGLQHSVWFWRFLDTINEGLVEACYIPTRAASAPIVHTGQQCWVVLGKVVDGLVTVTRIL